MANEMHERMDRLVYTRDIEKLKEVVRSMTLNLRMDGFDNFDIEEYINELVDKEVYPTGKPTKQMTGAEALDLERELF